MRIVHVAGSYPPRLGGMEFHVQHLAEALAARGHDLHVVTAPVEGALPEEIRGGVHVRRIPLAALARGGVGLADIVHGHGARVPYSAVGLARAARAGSATVFTPHCFYPAVDLAGWVKRAIFDPTLGRAALRASRRVIALTENDLSDGVALGGARERFRIVPNAVDFEGNDAALAAATEPIEPYPERYVLFTGRVDRNKHVDFLVDAVPGLLARGLRLVVIGPDGGELEAAKARARVQAVTDVVQFRGSVSRAELMWAIKHAAVVALPSRYEGLPTSLLEAAAVGTPVVGAAKGGTPYLLAALESGFAFTEDDHAGFLAAIDGATGATPEARQRSAEQVRTRYSWPRVVDEVLAVYAEVS